MANQPSPIEMYQVTETGQKIAILGYFLNVKPYKAFILDKLYKVL